MNLSKIIFSFLLAVTLPSFAMDNLESQLDSFRATLPGVTIAARKRFIAQGGGCQNVIGCELVAACQDRYKKDVPALGSQLTTKSSELPKHVSYLVRQKITQQMQDLAARIPYVSTSLQTGQPIQPTVNSKRETVVQFSQSPYYGCALAAIKPFNNPDGLDKAVELTQQNTSLCLVPRFDFYKKLTVGTYCDSEGKKTAVMICGKCENGQKQIHNKRKKISK